MQSYQRSFSKRYASSPSARQRSKFARTVVRIVPSSSGESYAKLLGEQMTPLRTSHNSSGFCHTNLSWSLKNVMVRSWPRSCGWLSSVAIVSQKVSWPGAREAWRQVAVYAPGDAVAGVFLERILHFEVTPPKDGWDGATSLEKL